MRKYFLIISSIFIFSGCFSDVNFMGASKWVGGEIFVERWYLNPEYDKKEIPSGTAFYGAAAEKIKYKFTVKYYLRTENGKDDIPMPLQDLWTIKHNGKERREQDDDNLFYYQKFENKYINKKRAFSVDEKIPIQECYADGWCKLYGSRDPSEKNWRDDVYVRKSILNKPLSEEPLDSNTSNRKIDTFPNIVKPASLPWVSPSKEICESNNGMFSNKNVCQATFHDAQNICRTLNAKIPLIEQLEQVWSDCASEKMKANEYDPLKYKYIECINKKGFTTENKDKYNYLDYWSSTLSSNNATDKPKMVTFEFAQKKKTSFVYGTQKTKWNNPNIPDFYNKLSVMCIKE
jgi:hypothetical protein